MKNTKKIQAQFDEAVEYHQNQQLQSAEMAYRKVLKLYPELVAANYNLGVALFEQKKLTEAEFFFREAAKLNPDYVKAHFSLGHLLILQNKFEEASSILEPAVKKDPNNFNAVAQLGDAFLNQNKLEKAILAYQKAVEIDPDADRVHLRLGNIFAQQGDIDQAVLAYEKVLEITPNDIESLLAIGKIYFNQQKREEAQDYFRKVLRLQPDHLMATLYLGSLAYKNGDLEKAETYYKMGISLTGEMDYDFIYLDLALILASRGKLEEAYTYANKYIELFPESDDVHLLNSMMLLTRKIQKESDPPQTEAAIVDNFDQIQKFSGAQMALKSFHNNTREKKPLFFYHVPKCAGISIRSTIRLAVKGKMRMSNQPVAMGTDARFDLEFDGTYQVYNKQKKTTPYEFYFRPENSYQFITAWEPFGFHEKFKKDFNLITTVRDPFARIVSRFKYLCWLNLLEYSEKSFAEFYKARPQINHQSKILGGALDQDSTEDLYHRAIENLSKFYIFTTIDNTDKLLTQALTDYGLPNVISRKINVSPSWAKSINYELYRDEILSMNDQDQFLFEFVEKHSNVKDYANHYSGQTLNALTVLISTLENREMLPSFFHTEQLFRDLARNNQPH